MFSGETQNIHLTGIKTSARLPAEELRVKNDLTLRGQHGQNADESHALVLFIYLPPPLSISPRASPKRAAGRTPRRGPWRAAENEKSFTHSSELRVLVCCIPLLKIVNVGLFGRALLISHLYRTVSFL